VTKSQDDLRSPSFLCLLLKNIAPRPRPTISSRVTLVLDYSGSKRRTAILFTDGGTTWTWSYVSGHSTTDRTDLLEVNPFIFTNTKKNNIDNKVKNGESKAFNTFLPGNTEGSYVDSKPRTTTTTTP